MLDQVAPYFKGLAGLFPGLAPLQDQLDENRRAWETYDDEVLLEQVGSSPPPPRHLRVSDPLR